MGRGASVTVGPAVAVISRLRVGVGRRGNEGAVMVAERVNEDPRRERTGLTMLWGSNVSLG